MLLTLAAVAAVAAALIELTVTPFLEAGGAYPHPVLVLGVIWTLAVGVESGFAWAFVGGLALDVLAQRPLGVSAFAMLLAVGFAAVVGAVLGRARGVALVLAPVLATVLCSPLYSMLILFAYSALAGPVAIDDPLRILAPNVVADVVLAVLVGPLAVSVALRRRDVERVDW
jgi:rod shape-determining protein MreD